MGRKRQRSADDDDDDDDDTPAIESEDSTQDRDPTSNAQSQADTEEEEEGEEELTEDLQRERDVWDAFKEEHHDVLEQLPLSLHRQFKLMRELDAHGEAFQADLLASVQRYICLRENLAAQRARDVAPQPQHVNGTVVNDVLAAPAAMQVGAAEPSHREATSGGQPATGTAYAAPPMPDAPLKPGETTRQLLQHIAQTSEEAIRAAEEKVSIAQTAYESVDRQIRLLDQAIKEQEAAISLGVRPGTHLAPILLPDLVVPRWARPPRVEHSPVPSLSPEPELYAPEEPPALDLGPPHVPPPKAPKKGKKPPAKLGVEKEEVVSATAVAEEARTRRTTSVKLTIPAQPRPQPEAPSVPADPNETRYCYCHQVSFGTMIACDGEGCKLEWFHLGCTGLSDVPSKKTDWYCRECKSKMTQKGRSRT